MPVLKFLNNALSTFQSTTQMISGNASPVQLLIISFPVLPGGEDFSILYPLPPGEG
jgi:hypothetical protein